MIMMLELRLRRNIRVSYISFNNWIGGRGMPYAIFFVQIIRANFISSF